MGSPPPAPVHLSRRRRPGRPPRPRRRPRRSPVDSGPRSSPRSPPRSGRSAGRWPAPDPRFSRISWTPLTGVTYWTYSVMSAATSGSYDEVDELERRRRVRGADRDHRLVEEQVAALGGPAPLGVRVADQGAVAGPADRRDDVAAGQVLRVLVAGEAADLTGVDAPRGACRSPRASPPWSPSSDRSPRSASPAGPCPASRSASSPCPCTSGRTGR